MNEFNEFVIFEEYIKFVSKKIMSLKKRKEISDELYSHLLEEYDKNIALGFDDLTAQKKAVEKMGNKEKIADDFGKIYPVIPTVYMRSSLNLLIWGTLLTSFTINLFPGFSEITKFIGNALFIYGLFKLRKTSKRINFALVLSVSVNIVNIILQTVCFYVTDYDEITFTWATITIFTTILIYGLIFTGINSLCKTILCESDKKPHLYLGYTMYIFFTLTVYNAYVLEAGELVLFAPIFLIVTLVQLGKARKVLSHQEPEFELKHSLNKVEKIICWALVVVLAITPIISMIVSANATPEYKLYNTNDTNISQDEISNAKEHILKLGLPKDILDDLPDSEILKYKDATYLQTEKADKHTYNDFINKEHIIANVQAFNFYFADGKIRILMRAEIPEGSIIKHRAGVYFNFYTEEFVPIYDENDLVECEKLHLALAEKNGETVSYTPLSLYTPKNSLENFYTVGFEFNFEKEDINKRVYIAHSAKISKPNITNYLSIDGTIAWQHIPVTANYKSINDCAREQLEEGTFYTDKYASTKYRHIYNSFEFEESYTKSQ